MKLFKPWMTRTIILSSAIVAIAATVAWPSGPADAAVCVSRMSGQGAGTGIAGAGSRKAKANAMAAWSRNVQAQHGSRYASLSRARSVRTNCRGGLVIEATCTVSAEPCRADRR